ncbi:MAG: helix-turn-helix transcriptional regulator [Ruminococcaceae bacterium]|nr:helix-turn-helix transcriptional regulator [Oscillospiraceae bacterium]
MIHAYDKVYLEKARTNLGRMLDFAVYDLEYDMEVFFDLFLSSGVARRFESGDFSLIAGMSGIELAYKVLECLGRDHERIKPRFTQNRSPEYWTGWALAYYQWETALSFSEITQYIPIKDIADLYSPYHEMDIRQFTDKMNELYGRAKTETNLRILRKKAGLTQKELAEMSGVPLRTVQQYEQRRKDINKARAEYVVALSKVLYCDAEDLLEKHT